MTEMASSKYMFKSYFSWSLTDAGVDLVEQCGGCCEKCPFQNVCADKELYYSCYVWEDDMNEDL